MPRTFKATIALIVTLGLLTVLTLLNTWQVDSTEEQIIKLRQEVSSMNESQSKILKKLEQGVAVSSEGGGRGASSGSGGKYADSLDDPDNILEPPTKPRIAADKPAGGTYRRRLSTNPKGFNFLTENGADVQRIQTYIHNSFARRDLKEPDKFVPGLAHKITVNDDYTEYTIHIREGVKWHLPNVDLSKDKFSWLEEVDRELTAEDCAFTFRMVTNPKVEAGAAKSYFKDLKKVKVLDRYTFKVIWKEKTHQSLSSTLTYYPLPKWLFTRKKNGEKIPKESLGLKFNSHWAGRHPVGTGPYKLTKFRRGSRIVLKRNSDYWGPKPPLETIKFEIIKKPQTGYLRLKDDKLDFTRLSPSLYKNKILEGGPNNPFKQGKLEYKIVDRFAYYYFGWNADKPMFSSPKVRKAMTHALNRKEIINRVLHGLGHIQTGPFYYDHPANNPKVEPLEFNLDKSRKLLNEAGWTDSNGDGIRDKKIDGERRKLKFKILAYNKPRTKAYLSIYRENLRKIGVEMTPKPVDWPTMQKKMNQKEFDAYTGGWALAWGIDPYQIWHSSQADIPKGSNRVGFRNERADQIIEKLRKTFDKDKRIELLREFHMLVHKKQPYTFFYAPKTVYAWQPRLENVHFQKIRPQTLALPWFINPDQRRK